MNKAWLIGLILLFMGCKSKTDIQTSPKSQDAFQLSIPEHFPEMDMPEDNPLSVEKVALGKQLFFDPRLSADGTKSCASCHHVNYAFSDTAAQSRGVHQRTTERNSPSLMNIGFHPRFMREGAVPSLELQVLSPLEGETEMGHNLVQVCEELNAIEDYQIAFKEVFDAEVTPFTLTRAIATYERTLIGGNSRWDDYLLGDSSALSPSQQLGLELFQSERLGCIDCHSGVLLSNFKMENNGLYASYADQGLFRLTLKEEDRGKFKIPSLRNITLTSPYMHDGSLSTLNEVIDHYASGGKQHPNQSENIKGFELSSEEREALLEFFGALTEKVPLS